MSLPTAAPKPKRKTSSTPSRIDAVLESPSATWYLLAAAAILASLNVMGALRADEVWSLNTVAKPFAEMMAELRGDIHPPLYYWLLFPWVRIFGDTEFALRSLSGLFYLASVFALHRGSRQIIGARTATITAAIYLTTPLTILAAHMARMYSLLSLISILSTQLYWTLFVEEKRSRGKLALFALVNALGTMTHIWFFFLLFAEATHWLILRRKNVIAFTAAMAASLAPYTILWLPTLLRQLGKSQEAAAWLLPPTASDVGVLAFLYAGTLCLLLPPAIWHMIKRRIAPDPSWIGWTLLLITTLAVPFAISFIKPVFYSRFTVVGLHLFALAAAACISRVSNWQLPVLLTAIAVAGCAYSSTGLGTCDGNWGANYLVKQAADGDTAIFPSLSRPPVDYYLQRKPSGSPAISETSFPAEIDAHPGYEGSVLAPSRQAALKQEAEALAARLKARGGRVFYLRGFHPEVDAYIDAAFDRAFRRDATKSFECNGMPSYYNAITAWTSTTP
ncbi:MAG: glycosyltransferase family 39 protein [Bryobacteraceae bacterium]